MSASSSKSGDVIFEVKTEEIGSEVKKDESEIIYIKDKDEDEPESEDVIIEVNTEEIGPEVKKDNSEIKLYETEAPDKYFAVSSEGDFLVELVLKDFDFELQMYDIKISKNKDNSEQKSYRELSRIYTIFKFTNGQINLSKDKQFSKKDDISNQKDQKDEQDDINNQKDEKDKQRTDKNSQKADIYTLIILSLSGIYKCQMKNKLIKNIQKLNYPKRVYNDMINNLTHHFNQNYNPVYEIACHYMYKYIKQCLNQHYFLADTMNDDIKYIELYDLNTNHLVNIFQRQNSSECGLEIAELVFIWDIFGSLRDSSKLKNLGFKIELPSDFYEQKNFYKQIGFDEQIKQSNSFMVVDKGDELLEPWLLSTEKHSRYLFYLDKKKEKLLLIGNHTIQVWHNQGPEKGPKKRSLEFIHVPLSHSSINYAQNSLSAMNFEKFAIEVIDINCYIRKFKLNFKYFGKSYQIKMEDKNDIMNILGWTVKDETENLKSMDVIEQTRKIILKFIRLHPTEWRLLGIRYNLMSALVEAEEYELVNYILSSKEPLHIPQYISWEDKKNTIQTACSVLKRRVKKNHNIGWINKFVGIISKLYKSNKIEGKEEKDESYISEEEDIEYEDEKVESYVFYAQKLFYHPCFYEKRLNLISFKFFEISPKANGLLKVLIPITQLIPQDYFTTNKKIFDIREKKFTDYLNLLISPIQYLSLKEEDHSPFISSLKKIPKNIETIFILLGYLSYIGLKQSSTIYEITKGNNLAYTMTGDEPDNPFSNIICSILVAYDWDSISFDTWNYWPLTIISIICSFIFVTILQNIIISYMGDAFSDAVKDSKCAVYRFQIDFIHEFALFEKSLEFNNLDSKFKDKIRAKYICFYYDPDITSSWKKIAEKMESEPYSMTQIENITNFEFLSDEDCEFIWGKVEKDTEYWFFEK
ncbi:hypothetical protein C2G38_2190492 [Gigaspora rosea]|uniref:Ion transport domain-containing protein n=1 Tax=Gigaspora rosea TaxID=44941 RepID=A0A397V4E8_9GLOM|nr:hypothetical protein C2G38_2190492 [Gigaspora rosea]